jgi:hypothetical protein
MSTPVRSRIAWTALLTALLLPLAAVPAAAGPEAVDGALTSGDSVLPSLGNGGYDVQHYDIDLAFQPGGPGAPGTIAATTTIEATALFPLKSFGLDFKGLAVTSVTVNGVPATPGRVVDPATDTYKLVVTPATPVDGPFTVAITYAGQPEAYPFQAGFDMEQGWLPSQSYVLGSTGQTYAADGGATGIGQPGGTQTWYPNNATPADKASYTTRLTVPNAYSAVGIGRLVAKNPVDAARTQWVWDEPMPTTTFLSVAAIGQFVEQTDEVEVLGQTIPLTAYSHPGLEAASLQGNTLAVLKDVLRWEVQRFGTYQPSVAGYIASPIAVGWALEIQGKPFFSWPITENVLVHEMAHQWAGNSVSVADWRDLWLAEGFARFTEWLWREDHGGENTGQVAHRLWSNYGPDMGLWTVPVAGPNRDQLWGDASYNGGGLALAALRAGVGDAAFFELVRTWFSTYANSNASTGDFIALAELVTGRDLTRWAEDWLFSTGRPEVWPAEDTFPVRPAGPDDCTASPITVCTVTTTLGAWSGRLEVAADRDWIRFTAPSSGTYNLTVAAAGGGLVSAQLRDQAGIALPVQATGPEGKVIVTQELDRGRTVYIDVSVAAGSSGVEPVAYTVTAALDLTSFIHQILAIIQRLAELIQSLLNTWLRP